MAITVIEIPKVILSLSLESGGDLPDATTYYFIGWIGQGAGYYGGAWGEASDQISITTTAPNQQIRIDWEYWHDSVLYTGVGIYDDLLALIPESLPGDTVRRDSVLIKWDYYSMLDGGGDYYKWCNLNDPAITDEFQDGSGHRRWMQSYAGSGIRADYGIANTASLTGSATQGVYNHGQVAWRYDIFDMVTPFPMEKSDLVFIVTGTGNTEWTLINCIETMDATLKDRVYLSNSNDYVNPDVWNILMKGSIIGDSVTSELTLNKLTLTTVSCTQILLIPITFNDCHLANNRLTPNFWITARGTYNDTVFHHSGIALILDNVIADNFKPWCRSGTTNYGAITGLYIDNVSQHQWRYFRNTMPITDSTFSRTVLTATAYSLTHDYTGENAITWTNVSFIDSLYGWDVSFTYNYIIDPEYAYDEINAYGVTVNRPDGKLRCKWTSYAQALDVTSVVNVFQPFNLTVEDKDGVEIVGATVTIIDNTSFEYSDVTDSNGEYSETVKAYSVELDPLDSDGYGNSSKTISYAPMTLLVNKSGYIDFTRTITTLDEPLDTVVVLKEAELSPLKFTTVKIT